MLIDPWGNILGQLEEKPGVLVGEIDMNRLGGDPRTAAVPGKYTG